MRPSLHSCSGSAPTRLRVRLSALAFCCAQAMPYCWTLMYIPMHFLTHELLLFATGIWTTNIHDCIHGLCAAMPTWLSSCMLLLPHAIQHARCWWPWSGGNSRSS